MGDENLREGVTPPFESQSIRLAREEDPDPVPEERRWRSERPGTYPGPADEVVKVELVILYPAGFEYGPVYKVGRWWPADDAALTGEGGFESMHGQYRLADNAATAVAHLAEFAHAACTGAILRSPLPSPGTPE